MRRLAVILALLFSSLLAAFPVTAETITGSWATSVFFLNSVMGTHPDPADGPVLFGNLPEAGRLITEVATVTAHGWTGGTLPIPEYSDGSPADPSEVFWTVQVETFLDIVSLSLISGSEIVIAYMGGSAASLALQGPPFVGAHCLGGQITVDSHPSAFSICASVTAVAVRTDAPVPVQETTIGRVKAMYK